jgi:large subunit ribosomal protein L22
MEVRAVEKYIRISPKKARLVADMVRGQNAKKSLTLLKFVPKKAARIIYKALNSAVANAENNFNMDGNALVVTKISIDAGPSLKRFRPRARGMAAHLKKRTSHITVVVSDGSDIVKEGKKVKEVQTETASEVKEVTEGAEE